VISFVTQSCCELKLRRDLSKLIDEI